MLKDQRQVITLPYGDLLPLGFQFTIDLTNASLSALLSRFSGLRNCAFMRVLEGVAEVCIRREPRGEPDFGIGYLLRGHAAEEDRQDR